MPRTLVTRTLAFHATCSATCGQVAAVVAPAFARGRRRDDEVVAVLDEAVVVDGLLLLLRPHARTLPQRSDGKRHHDRVVVGLFYVDRAEARKPQSIKVK